MGYNRYDGGGGSKGARRHLRDIRMVTARLPGVRLHGPRGQGLITESTEWATAPPTNRERTAACATVLRALPAAPPESPE